MIIKRVSANGRLSIQTFLKHEYRTEFIRKYLSNVITIIININIPCIGMCPYLKEVR